MDAENYKNDDLILVITKEGTEANVRLSSFPDCLKYVEAAEDYCPIDEWDDGLANGTILVRASADMVDHTDKIVKMINKIHVHKVGHVSYDYDRDCDSHSAGVERKNIVDEFFCMINDGGFRHELVVLNSRVEDIFKMIQSNVSESFDCEYGGTWAIMTEEEFMEEESEKERKSLEQSASWFAQECGHAVGSVEYVRAAQEALAMRERNMDNDCYGERKMERAAASRFSGQSSEDYWSDEDYIRSKHEDSIGEIASVLQWLETNCPLLMLKVQEQDLSTGCVN
jgi:hypothetical protein